MDQQKDMRPHKRRADILRLGLFILVAQALFWGLFYIPWSPDTGINSVDRIEFRKYEVAELTQPTPAAADAAQYEAVELPYTDCCDPAYLALKASFNLDNIPESGLGLVGYQQVDNFIIRVNGSIVHQIGSMQFGEQSFHGQRPYLIRIPAGLLKPGGNELSIITVRHGFPYSDLGPILMGSYPQLEAATASRFWQSIDLRLLGGWLTFILGLFALILLVRSKARAFAAWLVTLCWSWTAFAAYGLMFDLPFGGVGRMMAFYMIYTAIACSMLGFIDAWTGHPIRRLGGAIIAIWAIFNIACYYSLSQLDMPRGYDLTNEGWIWFTFILSLAVIARLLWHFARVSENRYLEAALLSICATCLALDAIGDSFGLLSGGYLMDSAALLLLSFVVAFVQRNFTLFQSAMELNTLLENTVKARENELAAAHERERDLVGREARNEERRRLMRDMHDGVGSQLVGMLLTIRRGAVDQTRIAEGLQGVMDEIRLMIDSVDTAGTSLAAMLDVFEARVRPRVEGAGFAFGWQCAVAEASDFPPQQVLHLFRLMQEAVTNALKHSGGSKIDIAISAAPNGELIITITDDGKGLTQERSGGHGLTNMRTRAQAIGGEIAFNDASPGLCITLCVPIHTRLQAAA